MATYKIYVIINEVKINYKEFLLPSFPLIRNCMKTILILDGSDSILTSIEKSDP